MHPNPSFRPDDEAQAREIATARGFGVLTVVGPEGVLAAHIPFLLDGPRVAAHLVRSNPIARLLRAGPVEALLVVSGPDAYVSPDWYALDDQVPTWNYVAVHLRGTLSALPDTALRPHLDDVSAAFEGRLAPKKPWTLDKNTPETLSKLMRMIVPVEMSVGSVDSTLKLNQNKPDASRHAAADEIAASPVGLATAEVAAWMRRLG